MLKSMDTLVALCKNRGYIYPGSEIYGGLANTTSNLRSWLPSTKAGRSKVSPHTIEKSSTPLR